MVCEGSWNEVRLPYDGSPELSAYRCDGCDELLVTMRGRGFDFPAGTATQEGVRSAIAQYFGKG